MNATRNKAKVELLYSVLAQCKRWLVVINADPDAVGTAMAFKRLAARRVGKVAIARINDIQRPDNLALLRQVRAPIVRYDPIMLGDYDAFAIVDSQPSHNTAFAGIPFSVIIDHHPVSEQCKEEYLALPFVDIRPDYGAASTILCGYLQAARITPGRLLATALLYGIRTDTASFTRPFSDIDMRAYRHLARYADHTLISSIVHSEFRLSWLPLFARALRSMRRVGSSGFAIFMNTVDNPDLLVVVADFLMRVHEIHCAAVYGRYQDTVIVVLRSNGSRNIGELAQKAFGDIGTAGGHKTMGRAEIPISAFPGGAYEEAIFKRLHRPRVRKPKSAPAEAPPPSGAPDASAAPAQPDA